MAESTPKKINGWQVDRRVSAGNLISTVAMIAMVAAAFFSLKERVLVNSLHGEHNTKAIAALLRAHSADQISAAAALRRIEDGVDDLQLGLAQKIDRPQYPFSPYRSEE